VKSISDLVKAAIKALILERFDVFAEKAGVIEEPVQSVEIVPPTANGNHTHTRDVSVAESKTASPMKREAKSEGLSDMADSPPPKKKRKSMIAEDDAALAARLQAEENTRSRPLQGSRTIRMTMEKVLTPAAKSQ
jgi:upstream activation factor subunit UAF30